MRVQWLTQATSNLRAVHRHIAVDNPQAAKVVVRGIRAATDRLRMFPDSGRNGTVEGTRELVVPNLPYLIVYRLRGDYVEILTVLHSSSDWVGDLSHRPG